MFLLTICKAIIRDSIASLYFPIVLTLYSKKITLEKYYTILLVKVEKDTQDTLWEDTS